MIILKTFFLIVLSLNASTFYNDAIVTSENYYAELQYETAEVLLDKELDNTIAAMTIDEKVGQMFLVRCPVENGAEIIENYHVGGLILFANFFKGEDKTSIKEKIDTFQSKASIPLLISVDEEGGIVNRISKFKAFRDQPFQSPQKLYSMGGFENITADTIEKSELLLDLGINVNMAPVCDISLDTSDFIYSRSFGKNAEETSQYIQTVVTSMNNSGIGSVLKHFPGYGNNNDTHTGVAYDSRGIQVFYDSEFKPFIAGIESGADAILVSHNIVEAFDKTSPASLSLIVHQLLRNELNYEGVLITDDLVMDGIRQFVGVDDASVMAVLAGNDMLCCTDYSVQIPAVIQAVNQGIISESHIDVAVKRILKWKLKLNLIQL